MRFATLAAAAVLMICAAHPGSAAAASGEMRCSVAGGIGFVVAAKRATNCIYYRRDGRVEFYIGSFGRLGLDFGPAQARQAIFAVSAPDEVGALDGEFAGVGVGATLGSGIAGDALIGGRAGAASIVPIANSRLTGLNVSAGLDGLHLRYAGTDNRRERYHGTLPDDLR